ncbi:MAG: hypothetical protein ACREIK_08230 [Nitrospiraceae bacterium]
MKKGRMWLAGTVVSLWACLLVGGSVQAELKLPPVGEILLDIKFSDKEQQRVREGKVVERTISEGSERELAFAMALLVKAKPEKLAESYRKATVFDVVSQVKGHGRIPGEGALADFAGVALQPNAEKEAQRYLGAQPGEELNLEAKEIAAFQELKSASGKNPVPVKEVEQLVRQGLLARYQAYRAKGLAGIAPYERAKGAERLAGDELLRAAKGSVYLAKYVPAFYDLLLDYPAAKKKADMKNLEEFFYWVNLGLFDRPTFVLMHRMALQVGEAYVAVERQFYASHEYNSMQQLVAALPTQDGTLLVYAGRVSTDQVGGFGSSAKHPVARTLAAPYLKDMFESVRGRVEKR